MTELGSLYIEHNTCGSCSRCVRECAVKAITYADGRAMIVPENCVECGECVSKCKSSLIRIREDAYLARQFIKNHDIKVASVSPSWVTEFPGVSANRLVEALKLLGFTHVSESALGAEATLKREKDIITERGGINISSRCPAVVSYIRKYRPRLSWALLPVASPMIAHARMIRHWWGENTGVVHFSSCIAAKREAEESDGVVELALTFGGLKRWLKSEGINFDKISGTDTFLFEPHSATEGLCYPLEDGGSSEYYYKGSGVTPIVCSSLTKIDELLSVSPQKTDNTIYLDLMACSNGCLGSNGNARQSGSQINRWVTIEQELTKRHRVKYDYTLPEVDLSNATGSIKPVTFFVAENDTLKALSSLGIESDSQQIDCNGCGYVTCRRFAKALSKGFVTRNMCVHFAQTDIQAKFTTLLEKLAAGVAIVNSDLKIVEANRMLAGMLGADAEAIYNANPGFRGTSADEILPFSKFIYSMIDSGDESLVRDVQVKERLLTVSIHTVQKGKLFLVLCRSMYFSQVRNEEIVSRTQKVIKENLETVQKMAFLLGENAARTEAILNSILNPQTSDND